MSNQIPERLINFTVYGEGNRIIGVADAKLPSIEMMTETVSGAGIAGELESGTLGHFKPMTVSLKWRTLTSAGTKLFLSSSHQVDFRGSQPRFMMAGTGKYKTVSYSGFNEAKPKKLDLGSLQVAKATDSENEFEVLYIKLFIDGKEVLEIDKLNFICIFDGEDILKSVRDDLGL
ncbi:phage major tail tube protein [Escherichia coli]|uniref:phage major tail tube protein n=2 Tax=Escherichia coli TaxID=562 RepID=UPI000DFF99AB|nr:phage major tail tube protein [Escherichia coli]STL59953.1 phage tail core protein [Escherichia coli]